MTEHSPTDFMRDSPFDLEHAFNTAVQAYENGDFEQAENLLATILETAPTHPGAHHLSGLILLRQQAPERALQLLQRAAQLAPNHPGILRDTAQALSSLGSWEQALHTYNAALRVAPEDKTILTAFSEALLQLGQPDSAIVLLRQAILADGNDPALHNAIAFALNLRGDYEESIREFEAAASLSPQDPDIIGNLATLYENTNQLELAEATAERGLTLAPDHDTLSLVMAKCLRRANKLDLALKTLDNLQLGKLATKTRRAIEFEYGRILDASNDSTNAYDHFTKGNSLAIALWPNIEASASWYRAQLEQLNNIFTSDWVSSWSHIETDNNIRTPVFLVGFPRSGTTLLDTLLGTYPGIAILEERPTIERIISEISRLPGGYPRSISTMTEAQAESLRSLYWHSVNQFLDSNDDGANIVIDKQPLNSIHAGLIHRLFPAAKFIYLSRHPCDICLSCFMQEFGPDPAYASFLNLEDAARCYILTMNLWEKYSALLPVDSYAIRYEDLVLDKKTSMENLTHYLGIISSQEIPDHTEHAQRRGRIYTPSYHQVVRPIYKDSMFKWKRYSKHFETALELLRPAIDMAGYST